MVWFGIFLYLLISSLKIRFCEQSVFAKSPLQLALKQILMIFAIGRYEARILMERVEAEDMSRRTEHEVCHLIVILLSSKEKHAMQS